MCTNKWDAALSELKSAEQQLQATTDRGLVDDAHNWVDECREALLEIPAPDAAALLVKMKVFMEREQDFLSGIIGDELRGVFSDVERLLPAAAA